MIKKLLLMNTKTIFGATLAAVFAIAMMTNPVFATSPALTITSNEPAFTMTAEEVSQEQLRKVTT